MYTPLNQYHVVMEVDAAVLAEPRGAAATSTCSRPNGSAGAARAPFAHYEPINDAARGQPLRASSRRSRSRSTWRRAWRSATRSTRSSRREREIGMPATIHGSFSGHGAGVPGVARERAAS